MVLGSAQGNHEIISGNCVISHKEFHNILDIYLLKACQTFINRSCGESILTASLLKFRSDHDKTVISIISLY